MSERLETPHTSATALGAGSARDDVALMLSAHEDVMPGLRAARAELAAAIDMVVESMSRGGRLLYAGAGTSGWLAALDAAEVVVTFGMAGRVDSVVGGGHTLDPTSMTLGDDAVGALADDAALLRCGPGDVAVAVSASGSTPFTVAAAEQLRGRGARVIAVVNDLATPLGELADVVVCVPISGELVAGSTRLTAGLAQKVILNTLSTAALVRLGRTWNGQMVCVEPLNDKLRQRIVLAIAAGTGVDVHTARATLTAAGRGDVAVVALAAGVDVDEARDRLARAFGSIPRAVSAPIERP